MRVLVLSSPIYAHTVNAASFVDGLAARGAEVHWGLADDLVAAVSHSAAELRGTGEAPPFPSTSGRLREVSRRYTWLLEDARARVARGLALAHEVRPDVVLTDSLGHVGALVAERLDLPWVSFGDGPLHFPDENTPPFGAGLPYRTEPAWQRRNRVVRAATRHLVLARAQQVYAVLRQEAGLPPSGVPVLEAALSPLLHLHCGVPELEYPRRALPPHVHFVGALRPPAPQGWEPPAWWEDVVAGGPVLATQGTLRADARELLGPVLTVLRRSRGAGILTTGPGDPGLLGGPGLVADRVAVERFVPYGAVLQHASVMVTNGGWTGVLLALAHGVPVIQVGRTEEKADIGRRVEWAGAGAHLPTADLRRLDAALERAITDPAVRAAAAGLAASLAGRDPGRDGAALMERVVRG
ncbi:glycosyltransferase [Ornithinimicrobium tianjinense]|uniref:Glycosyl transferase n=1 Tax=Ornithinimicrobium tianjinense TaxID=1195761 RepID=A0A917F2S3_9MICO|nr:nucleotide disphospho-sugar-binding domain-containing protein [Ornithinimicrobium tianjinense]GGF37352.1 glycosyl transferase [Ornithinimicrobium tianjinense]